MKKKVLSILLICLITLPCFLVNATGYTDISDEKMQKVAFRLQSLGIIEGYSDGSFGTEKAITRAEFTTIAMRILGLGDLINNDNKFVDVPQEHWAAGTINAACDIGLINGIGENKFAPENNVTYQEALKILVVALGYKFVAEKNGYPEGYIYVAGKEGLLDRVGNIKMTEQATRGDILWIVDNALDVPILEENLGTDLSYEVADGVKNTLYKKLLSQKEFLKVEGIVNSNEYATIDGTTITHEDYVKIGDKLCYAGENKITDYLGYYVDAYVLEESENGNYEISSFNINEKKNNVITLQAEDILKSSTLKEIHYTDENDDEEELQINFTASVLYNGRRLSSPVDSDIEIYNGEITLIDNSGDEIYDVIKISEIESVVVDKVSASTQTMYFDTGFTINNRSGYSLRNSKTNQICEMFNTDGEKIEFKDIKAGDVVSFEISRDDVVCKMTVSNKTVNGEVEAIDAEEGCVEIGGDVYYLYKNSSGTMPYQPKAGDEATFILDANGKIIGTDGEIVSTYKYGYVKAVNLSGSLGGNVAIQVAVPGVPVKEVTEENDTEIITYTYRNDEIAVLNLADRINYRAPDVSEKGTKVEADTLVNELKNKAIRYKLNDEGQVSAIEAYDLSKKLKYTFNAKALSFASAIDAFLVDESTQFVMLPEDFLYADEDDYLVEVKVVNGRSELECIAINVDPETQIAESVVLRTAMDADVIEQVSDTTAVSIVGAVREALDDDGNIAYKLHLLTKDEESYAVISEDHPKALLAKGLKKGDLIKYNEYSTGGIKNIEKVGSVSGLGDNYFGGAATSSSMEVYGIATTAKIATLHQYYNEIMDIITLDYGTGTITLNAPCDDGPECYLYERKRGNIYPATTSDILSADFVGGDADKVYICSEMNEPIVVVIVRD